MAKRGLYANIHAKRKRIAAGSGETMRKPAGMKGPMKKPNGEPTRKALALKKWGFGSVEAARNFANANKKKAKGGFIEPGIENIFD